MRGETSNCPHPTLSQRERENSKTQVLFYHKDCAVCGLLPAQVGNDFESLLGVRGKIF